MEENQEDYLNKIRERVLKREQELQHKEDEEANIQATLQALEEMTSVPRQEMEHIAAEIRRSHLRQQEGKTPEDSEQGLKELPATVREAYARLPFVLQEEFREEYRIHRHNRFTGYLLWAVPPPFSMQNFYGGRWFLQLIYTLSVGGFFLWWFVDFFRVSVLVDDYNRDQARKILKKILKSPMLRGNQEKSIFQKVESFFEDLKDKFFA